MNGVTVHPRVHRRHPEIENDDVIHAWCACVRAVPRLDRNEGEYIAVGIDGHGRVLELIAKRSRNGSLLIYHAMTPPTKKALTELGFIGR